MNLHVNKLGAYQAGRDWYTAEKYGTKYTALPIHIGNEVSVSSVQMAVGK